MADSASVGDIPWFSDEELAELNREFEDLAEFPDPDEHPEFYVDYDETGPYEAVTGDSECAT